MVRGGTVVTGVCSTGSGERSRSREPAFLAAGTVVTLLSTEQVHHFKAMLRKVDNTFVKDYPIPPGLVASLRSQVKEAMERAASREEQGK